MVGMTQNRHWRRAAAAAPIEPAIEASAERAAIERDPADPVGEIVTPSVDLPEDHVAVLPEPTLVAELGAPQPIVTASPILATEPSALDVVQAAAAAEREEAGTGPASDRDASFGTIAGQPTLTIEGGVVAAGPAAGDASPPYGRDFISVDDLVSELKTRRGVDPFGYSEVLFRLDLVEIRPASAPPAATVGVIEVVGPAQGRRRAGMMFGSVPQRFRASQLSEAQLAALRADPLLAVGVSEVAEADAPPAAFGFASDGIPIAPGG